MTLTHDRARSATSVAGWCTTAPACWARSTRPGVLVAADVHTARAIGRIGQEDDERVLLALALAVRALRNGSVCVDLQTVDHDRLRRGARRGVDLSELPWPEPTAWPAACRASPLVTADATGPAAGRCGWPPACSTWSGTGSRRSRSGCSLQDRLRRRPAGGRRRPADRRPGPAVHRPARRRASPTAAPGGGGQRPELADGAGRRAGHRQDHHRGPAAGPAAATSPAARCGSPWPPRPARPPPGWRRRSAGAAAELPVADRERLGDLRAVTLHRLLGWLPAQPAAGSGTTPTTSCRTTSWWSTRSRWCR